MNYDVTATLAVDDVAEAEHYCRKLAGWQWNSPTCVINGTDKKQVVEKCDIDFCGTLYCATTSFDMSRLYLNSSSSL